MHVCAPLSLEARTHAHRRTHAHSHNCQQWMSYGVTVTTMTRLLLFTTDIVVKFGFMSPTWFLGTVTKDCHPRKFQIEHGHRTQAYRHMTWAQNTGTEHGGREHSLRIWAHEAENISTEYGGGEHCLRTWAHGAEDKRRTWGQKT